jgi:p38 MAP kinase
MTGYVSMRHYRAPETMLTWQKYTVQVDIWSAGCILAEMIRGTPLFPGQSHADQFCVIVDLLGSVPRNVLQTISSQNVCLNVPVKVLCLITHSVLQTSKYIEALPARTKQSLAGKIKNASPNGLFSSHEDEEMVKH